MNDYHYPDRPDMQIVKRIPRKAILQRNQRRGRSVTMGINFVRKLDGLRPLSKRTRGAT